MHVLHTIGDTLALTGTLNQRPGTALIVGAGYIGLEMAEALCARGMAVTMVEQLPQVLPTVDPQLGALVEDELARHGVEVVTATTVTRIQRGPHGLTVSGHATDQPDTSFTRTVDVVLVVVGVRPDTALAEAAGVALGTRKAIAVDRHMHTTIPGIWAAGDCAVTYHRLLGTDAYLPLGSTAHKQGTVAGQNAVGGDRRFAGSLGTQVVKVFDLVAARTGLRDHEATAHGLHPTTHAAVADDHKRYYPGAQPIHIRITGDTTTGRLLGAQLVGHRHTAVAKRVDTYATALHHHADVTDVEDLDLSYTPPLGSPYDAVQIATHQWTLATATTPVA